MRSFDKWVRKGLYHARQNRPSDWEEAYDDASSRRFLFWGQGPQSPNLLLGVLHPSRDAEGRTYPFIVTCEIPKQSFASREWRYLPVHATSFFESAERVVRKATAGTITSDEITGRIEEINGISGRSTVPHEHKRYLLEETTGTFLEGLFGHFDDSEKYLFFSNLFETLLPLRSNGTRGVDRGLKFPLLNEGHPSASVVSFWSDLVWRVLQEAIVGATLFWSKSNPKPQAGHLLLYLGGPAPQALVDSLLPSRSGGRVFSLRTDGTRSPADAALSIPETYGELLEQEQIRLWDFLRRL